MSKNLESLESELQAAIAQLASDQLAAKEAQARIETAEIQKRRLESQLSALRERQRLEQVEQSLGSEVAQLRAVGDRINEKSRELFALLNEFESLRVSIVGKQSDSEQKVSIESFATSKELPVCAHRTGEPRVFLTTRGKLPFLRDNGANIHYGFAIDEILGQ